MLPSSKILPKTVKFFPRLFNLLVVLRHCGYTRKSANRESRKNRNKVQ